MKINKQSPSLRNLLLHILLFRLFIPLIILGLITTTGFAYLGDKNLERNQLQVAQSIANIVDFHIVNGEANLNAIARIAETYPPSDLSIFMKSTWESCGYFDTIYRLDKEAKIISMFPNNEQYSGFDMSNLPTFKQKELIKNLKISPPFISLRTGDPTVYLIQSLYNGGYIIGELNLSLFQREINTITSDLNKNFIFIMDQTGTLISHPSENLVQQQTNMSNLKIFHSILCGKNSAIYSYDGKLVLGSAVRVKNTDWIVVNQISLSDYISSYAFTFILASFISLLICLILIYALRKELDKHVITPIEKLTQNTNSLTIGDFTSANSLSFISSSAVEINKLLADFQTMSNNLQLREAALSQSENQYRGLVDRLPIGLFRSSLNGNIISVNPMLVIILGYNNQQELLNSNIIYFLYTASLSSNKEQFMLKKLRNFTNLEVQLQCKDGSIKWIEINYYVIYDLNEQEEFFEGSMQDITDRKLKEAKIIEQQKLLINYEKEKNEALEKALIMKDEFISLISHEFKTPLNVIYSAIQLMEAVYYNQIPEKVQKLIGNIKQNTFRQLRLANNLLDITRMNSGQFKLNLRNIDIIFLSKLITQSVELYANQKNIKMSFKSNIATKIISIDDEKYERIILNLLSNAIKFTDADGKITVMVNEKMNSDYLEIKVIDTGIGIPEDKQQLIFERFGQVDSNLSRQAEGTGIGLSLVKSLVNILGGTIELESKLGIGSTFTITLPVKKELSSNEPEKCLDVDNRLVNEIKVQFSDIYF